MCDKVKAEKLLNVFTLLDKNCPKEIRFLEKKEPWQFLFCVILSAQCTDKTVNKVAKTLFEKYKTPEGFQKASTEDIKKEIKSIGLYNAKAKNLKECATMLIEKYDKQVPDSIEELIKLPGVGRKTANCIIGDVYNKPAVICDTHFIRLANRLGLTKSSDATIVENDIKNIVPPWMQYRLSMTANYFARNICHKRKPKCEKCYLKGFCMKQEEKV